MEFGSWFKQKRQALDLTQESLAEAINCAVDTIRKIEAGRRRPSRQMAEIVADYFLILPGERAVFVKWARGTHGASEGIADFDFLNTSPSGKTEDEAAPRTTHFAPPTTTATTTTPERSPVPVLPGPTAIPSSPLPIAPTPLIGREQELAQIRALLWRSATRLVTLVGPPGIGKTRLAQSVAATLQDDFKDGLVYVPLVGITDPALVASTLARALGLREGQDTPLEAMQKALIDKQMLIVLDNFEQVVDAAPVVADLLTSASQIKILVTSRSPLHLRGEKLLNIAPLALPDPDHLPPLEELGGIESVALFVERVQDATNTFAITPENAQLVAQICVRLDGLPLAIELAAARTRLLSLSALNAKLEHQLGLLTGGPRDAPAHQQALRRAIESSYTLLGEDEQQLFRSLGIFIGPFSFEAAETVAGATLEGLEVVLDQSLVLRQPSRPDISEWDGGTRFSMLVSIHEYARENLVAHGELEELSLKHARYLLNLVLNTSKDAAGPNEERWTNFISTWLGDLRRALRWAIESGNAEIALSLGSALDQFWRRDRLAEGRRWLDEALAMSDHVPDQVRAKGLQVASFLAQAQSDYAKSRLYSQQSLPIYQKMGDKHGQALVFSALGVAAAEEGDYDQALSLLEQSLASWRDLGNTFNAAVLLFNMSFMAIRTKEYNRAIDLSQESLDAFTTLGNPRATISVKINIGLALLHKGEYERSINLHRECLAATTEIDSKREMSLAHTYLGLALLSQGDYRQAGEHYRNALQISQETNNSFGVLRSLLGLAGVAIGEGHPHFAVRLLSALSAAGFDAEKNSTPAEADLQERILTKAHEMLNPSEFGASWTVGQGLSQEEAVTYVLTIDDRR